MSVFLTGGSGFVGLNLAAQLLTQGEAVTMFNATPPPPQALAELSKLAGNLTLVSGDVTDLAKLRRFLERSRADRIVHGAAITANRQRDGREPQRIFDVNLLGTLNLLTAARDVEAERIVLVSTGAVFGSESFGSEFKDEDRDLPAPVTLYDISKFAAERAFLYLGELWGLDVVAGRLPMVFGPWEYQTGLRDTMSALWELSRRARAGESVVVPQAGVQDWMYGPDAARSLIALLEAPTLPHRLYHLGIEGPWGLREWSARLAERYPNFQYLCSESDGECTVAARGSLGRTPFSTRRLRQDLGFQPLFGLDQAFEHYMNWLDDHPKVWNSDFATAKS